MSRRAPPARGYWNGDGLAGLRAHPGGIAENLVSHPLLGKHNSSHDESKETYVVNGNSTPEVGEDCALPLRANDGSGNRQVLAYHENLGGNVAAAENARALRQGASHSYQFIAFNSKDHGADAQVDLAPTLRAGVHDRSHANAGVPPAIAFNWQAGGSVDRTQPSAESADALSAGQVPAVAFCERGREQGRTLEAQEELAYALTNPSSGGRTHSRQIQAGAAVRRLTGTECERLMGLPDGWTCLCGRNEGRSVGAAPCICKDGPRYRVLGNSVAIPVIVWLLRRIKQAAEEC